MTRRHASKRWAIPVALGLLLPGCQNPLEEAADRTRSERQQARDAELQNQVQAEVRADFQRMGNDLRPLLEIQDQAQNLFNGTEAVATREPEKAGGRER